MKNWMKYGSIGVCFWSLLLVLVGVSQLTFGAYYISKLPIFKIGSPVWIGFLVRLFNIIRKFIQLFLIRHSIVTGFLSCRTSCAQRVCLVCTTKCSDWGTPHGEYLIPSQSRIRGKLKALQIVPFTNRSAIWALPQSSRFACTGPSVFVSSSFSSMSEMPSSAKSENGSCGWALPNGINSEPTWVFWPFKVLIYINIIAFLYYLVVMINEKTRKGPCFVGWAERAGDLNKVHSMLILCAYTDPS